MLATLSSDSPGGVVGMRGSSVVTSLCASGGLVIWSVVGLVFDVDWVESVLAVDCVAEWVVGVSLDDWVVGVSLGVVLVELKRLSWLIDELEINSFFDVTGKLSLVSKVIFELVITLFDGLMTSVESGRTVLLMRVLIVVFDKEVTSVESPEL